jgi:hypothetical protein
VNLFEELSQASNLKPKPGEAEKAFARRVIAKLNKLIEKDEDVWSCLSEPSQVWFNETSTSLCEAPYEKLPLPAFTGYVAPAAEPKKPKKPKKPKPTRQLRISEASRERRSQRRSRNSRSR